MTELHKNYIGGEWVGGDARPNINPSNTNEVVGTFAQGTAEDARAAIDAAQAAFKTWSQSGIQQRHDILKAGTGGVRRLRGPKPQAEATA